MKRGSVWEEEVYFKLPAISPEQCAAGQFTSRMNNARALSREPLSSPFSAMADARRSFETWGNNRTDVCHLNNGASRPPLKPSPV